ncbi:MAG TPA: DUF1223 domain-containing protein [Terracidiphilus sp.]|jgi:hypothetical protein|nr:DUF1223 domain-containing protein [Terracidiphilus sp.]
MKRCFPAQLCRAAIVTFTMTLAGPAFSICQAPAPDSGSAPPKPVLVELFTSEGCSDCPPADDILSRLDREQPIPGVHVIVLSEHVTYWNHAGWRDTFSLDQMDQRQNDYVAQFHLQSGYTPQAVVDGAEQLVGNSPRKVVDAIVHQAAQPTRPLEITMAVLEKGSARFSVQAPGSQGVRLYAALAEDVTHSEVTRGENAGRTLHHVAVVRTLKQFKSNFADGHELSLQAGNLDTGSEAGALRLVVFLVDPHSGRIVSAAEKSLSPKP